MFNPDDEKIEFTLDIRALFFWQCKKAENAVFFISDVEISNSLYCQVQATRLIMFFPQNIIVQFRLYNLLWLIEYFRTWTKSAYTLGSTGSNPFAWACNIIIIYNYSEFHFGFVILWLYLWRVTFQHIRVKVSRGNTVDPDAQGGQVKCQRQCHACTK